MNIDRNWIETHHEVVCAIEDIRRGDEASITMEVGSLHDLAIIITDDFVMKQDLDSMDGEVWLSAISSFVRARLCKETQETLFREMVSVSGINVVTCGHCGHVVLHRSGDTKLGCPGCKYTSDPCDFPDLY